MSLHHLRAARFLSFFTLLAMVLSASPISVLAAPKVSDALGVTKTSSAKEKVAPKITIASPENEEVVDPTEPLTVNVDYEALHFNFPTKNGKGTVQPASFDAIELLLDGKSVAVKDPNVFDGKVGSATFEISPDMLPEDAQEITLQARAYSVYMPMDKLPVPFKGKALEHANKVAAESEVVTVLLGIDLEAIRAAAQEILDTNPDGDNDNDGLTNSFEILDLAYATQPDNEDSDEDGINDGVEDEDFDGLTNAEEQTQGTNPLVTDTDKDDLTDKEEIDTYSTDPTNEDTDGDGLDDGLEIELGTDPNNPDTDGDGIPDGGDTVTFTDTNEATGVQVSVTGNGNIKGHVHVKSLDEEPAFAGAPAFIHSFDIYTPSNESFDSAVITIPFDPSTLGDTNPSDLGIAYFNSETGEMEPLVDQVIDTTNNTVSGKTTHFSTYVLYDVAKMTEIFAGEFFGSVRGGGGSLVLVFDIDSSGSMSWNDPTNIRKTVAKDLIDSLEPEDKVGVVDLDSSAYILQEITTDKEAAKDAVDQINSSGGTNIGAAVTTANTMLINEPEDGNKIQILLTDGVGSYNPSYTQQAADNGIVIYTIGLGSSVDETLLRSIAEGTGGAYFQVSQASDLAGVFQTLKEETKDTDGDGLSDLAETNGMRTFWGAIITTLPDNPDSDGDGLTDGEEMGTALPGTFGRYYLYQSNPNSADSDGDGLTDKEEKDLGTKAYLKDSDGDGLDDGEEVEVGTEPLIADTDGDSLRDGVDPQPKEFTLYLNKENAENAVAILTLFSDATFGGGSSDVVFTALFGNHAFIGIENISDSNISIGKLDDVKPKTSVSLGKWRLNDEHNGLWYNREAYGIERGSYENRVSISFLVSSGDLEKIESLVVTTDTYEVLRDNCSSFASRTWNEVAPFSEEVFAGLGIHTPLYLAGFIVGRWPLGRVVGAPQPFDYPVYYANGTGDIILSEKLK